MNGIRADPVLVHTRLEFPFRRKALIARWRFFRLRMLTRNHPGLLLADLDRPRRLVLTHTSMWSNQEQLDAFRGLAAHQRLVRSTVDDEVLIWSRPFRLRGLSSLSVGKRQSEGRWFPARWRDDITRAEAKPLAVVTHLQYRRFRHALASRRWFRRLERKAHAIQGFVSAKARFEDIRTITFVSLWESEDALIAFTTLEQHVKAVRFAIEHEARVWSGVFEMQGPGSLPSGAAREATAWSTQRQQARGRA